LVPAINGSIPEAAGGEHSSQDGTVLDAAAGDAVDDDAPALVGAVNVVTAGDVEVEGVAVIAGKPTTPPVVRLVPATPAVVAAVCAVAGPASAIRRGSAMRNSRPMALSNSYLANCYEARARRSSPQMRQLVAAHCDHMVTVIPRHPDKPHPGA
jgi:hypothetical protein